MTSPSYKIEGPERRTSAKGLFPILNTMNRNARASWESTYKAASEKLAAVAQPTPTPAVTPPKIETQKLPEFSEFRLPPDVADFTQKYVPGGAKLPYGSVASGDAARDAFTQHASAWQQAVPTFAGAPYSRQLAERLSQASTMSPEATTTQKVLTGATEASAAAAPALMKIPKLPGLAGAVLAAGAPLVASTALEFAKDSPPALAMNLEDHVPLARVANAEQAYLSAHKAYASTPKTAPYEQRKALYDQMQAAHKAYSAAHDNFQKTRLTQTVKGKDISKLLPDHFKPGGQPVLHQGGLAEVTDGKSPGVDAALNVGRESLGHVFNAAMPGAMAIFAPVMEGARAISDKATTGESNIGQHGLEAVKSLGGPLTAAAVGGTLAKRIGPVMIANLLRQGIDFNTLPAQEQERLLEQALLRESINSANRTDAQRVGNAAVRGLGYLATGNIPDAAAYLGSASVGKDATKAVASEVAAKRFENQKVESAKEHFAQDPRLARYVRQEADGQRAGFEGADRAARDHQLYRTHLLRAVELSRKGRPEQLQAIENEVATTAQAFLKRLPPLSKQQQTQLQDLLIRYGPATMTQLWGNAPPMLIFDDLKKSAPSPSP